MDVAATSKQACDRDIFVEGFPVQADAAQLDLFAFG